MEEKRRRGHPGIPEGMKTEIVKLVLPQTVVAHIRSLTGAEPQDYIRARLADWIQHDFQDATNAS